MNAGGHPPNESALPGGRTGDVQPLDRGNGAWDWRRRPGEWRQRLTACHLVWHEGSGEEGATGWYLVARNEGGETAARLGPLRSAFAAADAIRDLLPAAKEAGTRALRQMDAEVDRMVDDALFERVAAAAAEFAERAEGPLRAGADPAARMARLQAACDDRAAWLQRSREKE